MVEPEVITDIAALRKRIATARQSGQTIGFVPTMGALHAGHISLVEASLTACDLTVVSIFVNPTQFGPNEDFAKYPRTLEADLKLLAAAGPVVVFAPSADAIYRPGHSTTVCVSGVTSRWEGAARPGHFDGVATIVLKLFNLTTPDHAFFGQKDFQQLLVIRRMTADLDLPIEIHSCPIVREADGLAMSSRNAYLSADERRQALTLYRALKAGADRFEAGERRSSELLRVMHAEFEQEPRVQLDYLTIADAETLEPVDEITGHAVALVAARVGKTRLIDNWRLDATG